MSKRFPRFPASIRIAGDDYQVELVASHPAVRSRSIGAINQAEGTIVLEVNQRPERARKVLLHELIHAADDNFGSGTLKEEQVEALENGLWAIFKDNPGLADVVFGEV